MTDRLIDKAAVILPFERPPTLPGSFTIALDVAASGIHVPAGPCICQFTQLTNGRYDVVFEVQAAEAVASR